MALLEKQLRIKKSKLPGAGKGLFTMKSIPKGTRIVEYKGEVIAWKEAEKMADDRNGYVFYVNSKHCIDAFNYKKALGRYANDARGIVRSPECRTNSEYVVDARRCYIESIKDVAAGEEIFVEYGGDYWKVIRYNIRLEQKKRRNGKHVELPHHKAAKRR